jgi:hypothetical protein
MTNPTPFEERDRQFSEIFLPEDFREDFTNAEREFYFLCKKYENFLHSSDTKFLEWAIQQMEGMKIEIEEGFTGKYTRQDIGFNMALTQLQEKFKSYMK